MKLIKKHVKKYIIRRRMRRFVVLFIAYMKKCIKRIQVCQRWRQRNKKVFLEI